MTARCFTLRWFVLDYVRCPVLCYTRVCKSELMSDSWHETEHQELPREYRCYAYSNKRRHRKEREVYTKRRQWKCFCVCVLTDCPAASPERAKPSSREAHTCKHRRRNSNTTGRSEINSQVFTEALLLLPYSYFNVRPWDPLRRA